MTCNFDKPIPADVYGYTAANDHGLGYVEHPHTGADVARECGE